MEVIVRNNNVEKALRVMKRKLKKEGLLLELKERAYYQKPSEKKRLAKKQAENAVKQRKLIWKVTILLVYIMKHILI